MEEMVTSVQYSVSPMRGFTSISRSMLRLAVGADCWMGSWRVQSAAIKLAEKVMGSRVSSAFMVRLVSMEKERPASGSVVSSDSHQPFVMPGVKLKVPGAHSISGRA